MKVLMKTKMIVCSVSPNLTVLAVSESGADSESPTNHPVHSYN